MSDYDVVTGRLNHTWPLSAGGKLADADNGVALYVAGGDIHMLRLSDGRDVAIRAPGEGPIQAQIEKPGLFYSYTAPATKLPSRVTFVSVRELLHRLG